VTNLWSERRTEPHDVVRLNWKQLYITSIATSLIKEEIHLSEDSVGKLPLDICVLSGHAIKISFFWYLTVLRTFKGLLEVMSILESAVIKRAESQGNLRQGLREFIHLIPYL
jgi:hypothetical protein